MSHEEDRGRYESVKQSSDNEPSAECGDLDVNRCCEKLTRLHLIMLTVPFIAVTPFLHFATCDDGFPALFTLDQIHLESKSL